MYEKFSTQAGNMGLMTAIDSLFRLLPHYYNDHDIMKNVSCKPFVRVRPQFIYSDLH